MTEKEYEVFERYSIIADDEGDMIALAMIRSIYGHRWFNWLSDKLFNLGRDDDRCTEKKA